MTVGVGGHVIDKVDNAIFQPPGVEAVHHMEHEWARVTFHTQPQGISSSLQTPELVPGRLNHLGAECSFDVNKRAAFDQLFAEIFHA